MSITLDVPAVIEARIDRLVSASGQSKAWVLGSLLKAGIEDLEDYFEAASASDRIRRGEERVYGAEEMRRELGLDD